MIPDSSTWKDIVTIGLASVGAVLGVMNTWNTISQRRVRLIVRPTYAYHSAGGDIPLISISVTNLKCISSHGFRSRIYGRSRS